MRHYTQRAISLRSARGCVLFRKRFSSQSLGCSMFPEVAGRNSVCRPLGHNSGQVRSGGIWRKVETQDRSSADFSEPMQSFFGVQLRRDLQPEQPVRDFFNEFYFVWVFFFELAHDYLHFRQVSNEICFAAKFKKRSEDQEAFFF